MSDLKACPFCGELAEIYDNDAGFSIECCSFSCRVGTLDSDWSKQAAIEIWNKRAPQDNWISVVNAELKKKTLYHVLTPKGDVVVARFNDYKSFGGPRDYWQDLHHNDFIMEGTKFIEIVTPTPPAIS